MARRSATRQCLQFPAVPAQDMLAILRSLAEHDFALVAQSELHIGKASETSWRIFLPVRSDSMKGGRKAADSFRARVKVAYKTEANFEVGREAEQGFAMSLDGLLQPLEASIILATQCIDETSLNDAPREKMVVVLGTKEKVAAVSADVIRHGRDVRTSGAHSLQSGKVAVFLTLTDAAEDYGSVSSYLRRTDLKADTYAMNPHGLGFCTLWLEEDTMPLASDANRALTIIMDAARHAGMIAMNVSDIACIQTDATSAEIFYHTPKTASEAPSAAEEIAPALDPVQPFEVTAIKIVPDEQAAASLQETIKELRYQVGYQVSLQALPPGVAPGVDLEPLLEQVEDLQLQIAQINALGAPQRRLMRFTDAQLPAMIDGLRKLPVGKLTDGSLLYAASHSAGRGEPAHYLSYDPTYTFMHVAEAQWKDRTEPHQMSYWLEPFVAEAQLERPSRTQVFVPAGHFLVPSLAHFGGNIDETLRLVLGNLFDGSQALIADADRSAYYVFTASEAQDFRLEVEVIDGDSFAPLDQQLHWINDYLQVRSPVAVDPARLADVAAAKALQATLESDISALDKVWSEARGSVEAEAMGAINAISSEMDAVSSRVTDLHSYLKHATKEMSALERVADSALISLKKMEGTMSQLSQKDDEMTRARMDFESRVAAEIVLAEKLIEQSEARISALHDRLERIKEWGRG